MTEPPPLPNLKSLTKPDAALGVLSLLSVPGAVASLLWFHSPYVRLLAFIVCLAVGTIALASIWSTLFSPCIYRVRKFDDMWNRNAELEAQLVDSGALVSQIVGTATGQVFSIEGGSRRSSGFVIFLGTINHPFPPHGTEIYLIDPFTGAQRGIACATSEIQSSRYLVATIDPARNQVMAGMIAEAGGDSDKFHTKSIGVVLVADSRPAQREPMHDI